MKLCMDNVSPEKILSSQTLIGHGNSSDTHLNVPIIFLLDAFICGLIILFLVKGDQFSLLGFNISSQKNKSQYPCRIRLFIGEMKRNTSGAYKLQLKQLFIGISI